MAKIMKRNYGMSAASQSTSNNAVVKNGTDRLSELPDDLLHRIVNKLGTKDAVRTTVLSPRWKNIHVYKSGLEFNWREIISADPRTYTGGNVSVRNVRKFQRAIETFLLSYLGTKIESFKVQCCFGNKHSRYFKGWINFAVSKNVENLNLAFSCDKLSRRSESAVIDYYNFPIELLSTAALKRLSLRTCKLRSDSFVDRFTILTNLVLCDVIFTGDLMPGIFSSCSNLMCVKLERCLGLEVLSLASLRCLTTVVVRRCEDLRWLDLYRLESLTTLHCEGEDLGVILFKVPNLQDVHLNARSVDVVQSSAELDETLGPYLDAMLV